MVASSATNTKRKARSEDAPDFDQDPVSDRTTEYARAVASGAIVAGPYVRLAAKRHLRDLERAELSGAKFYWDNFSAQFAIDFFPTALRLAEGEFAGKPFYLEDAQAFIVGSLFGWKNAADGFRRFRVAYLEIGKGNGKTPLAAGVALFMLMMDARFSRSRPRKRLAQYEHGAQVYAAAPTKEQAYLLFQDAVSMVEASPDLREHLLPSGKKKVFNLAHLASGSYFRPISSEGRALDGKRIHFAAVDEVHEHPTSTVVEKVRAGTKGRRQALVFMITNSGFDRGTVCYQWHDYSVRVLKDIAEDESLFAYVCALDEGDDWRDEKVWRKANPLLGVSVTEKYLREQVNEAIGMPAKQNIVRRLNFCEWTEAETAWITSEKWNSVAGAFDLSAFEGARAFGGLDLSLAKDLTALSLVFENDPLYAYTWFWTPGDTLREREVTDAAPYTQWVREGALIATPGSVVNYGYVADHIAKLAVRFDIVGIAFDEYRIEQLRRELDELGSSVPLVKHPQGFRKNSGSPLWMPESVKALETVILEKKIVIDRNPVMNRCASSAAFDQDAQGNRKFNKTKSRARIDGLVSLAMAVGLLKQNDAPAQIVVTERLIAM